MSNSESSEQGGPAAPGSGRARLVWFGRGVAAAFSVPGLILFSSFIGFAALAIESGISMAQTIFMTAVVWALPAKVVLIGGIMAANSLPAIAFAVALSSVRLTPMVVALIPEMRTEKTRHITLYFLSHFVAVTSWVLALERMPHMPREMRTVWYAGLGMTLIAMNMLVVACVYAVAEDLPGPVSAALLLLTPMYFLTSLWGSARERAAHIAMMLGLVLGPVFGVLVPDFSLLATGVVGGSAAYAYHRIVHARRAKGDPS